MGGSLLFLAPVIYQPNDLYRVTAQLRGGVCRRHFSSPYYQSWRQATRCSAQSDPKSPADTVRDTVKDATTLVSGETNDATSEAVSPDALPPSLRKGEEVSVAAQAILNDVAANPEYYLNVSGVLLGLILSIIVLSATTMALESLPLIPDMFRMVGLGYVFWFLAKFLFSAPDRQRLADEVDEFVSGVRGGEFRVLPRSSESDTAMMEGDEASLS